jgi:putative addiction module component (TIGR02574 family)
MLMIFWRFCRRLGRNKQPGPEFAHDQIVEETRKLPPETVAELVERIMVARHGGMDPSIEAAWKTESDRRIAEIEAGEVKGVPLEESPARARKIAGL